MTILIAILGLAFLMLLHESGHFYTARAVGMRPRQFYIGFPPALVKMRRNDIEYGIGVIPLGGYVKIPGMHRPAPSDVDAYFGAAVHEAAPALGDRAGQTPAREDDFEAAREAMAGLEEAVDNANLTQGAQRSARRGLNELTDALGPDSYWRQRTWKRLVVIGAGPAANLLFAILLLSIVYMIGIPSAASRRVESVDANTPAARAGLQPGDIIVGVNRVGTPTFSDVRKAIQESSGGPLVISVLRNGQIPYRELTPVRPTKRQGTYILGFRPSVIEYKKYGPIAALGLAGKDTWLVTKAMGNWLIHVNSRENRKQISTPVGIVRTSSEAARSGYRDYLAILALISLSLALLNLLPLLPLDGGHIAFSIVEGMRGKAVSRVVYERVSMVGIALILFIYVIGISNDISNFGGG